MTQVELSELLELLDKLDGYIAEKEPDTYRGEISRVYVIAQRIRREKDKKGTWLLVIQSPRR